MSCGGGGEKAAKEVRVSAKGRGSATEVHQAVLGGICKQENGIVAVF